MLQIKDNSQTLTCKQIQRCGCVWPLKCFKIFYSTVNIFPFLAVSFKEWLLNLRLTRGHLTTGRQPQVSRDGLQFVELLLWYVKSFTV